MSKTTSGLRGVFDEVGWRRAVLIVVLVAALFIAVACWQYSSGRDSAYLTGTVNLPGELYVVPPPTDEVDFRGRVFTFVGGQGNLSLGGDDKVVWANGERVVLKGDFAVRNSVNLFSVSGDAESVEVNGAEQLSMRFQLPAATTTAAVIAAIASLGGLGFQIFRETRSRRVDA